MRPVLLTLIWLAGCLGISLFSTDLQAADLERKVQFFVVQYEQGPAWTEGLRYEKQPGISEHLDYWQSLYYREILLMSGPWEDGSGGIFVIRANDLEMVKQIMADDPAVIGGLITTQANQWRVLSSAMRSVKPERIEIKPDETFRLERLDPSSPLNLKKN